MNDTCKPVSTRRRFTGSFACPCHLQLGTHSGRAAPKKPKKTRASDEWLAPRAKKADFKPPIKSRRKSAASSSKSTHASIRERDEVHAEHMRNAGEESHHPAMHGNFSANMQPFLGDSRYATYVGFNPGFAARYQPGLERHSHSSHMPNAGAAPRYPVYSHMENAAAWQPTAHSGFGGDMHFAYRGYSDLCEQSAAAASDALLHMGAERGGARFGRSVQPGSWMVGEYVSRPYMHDPHGRPGGYHSDAVGYSQYMCPSSERRYAPGHVPQAAPVHSSTHRAGPASVEPQWGSHAAASLGAKPGAGWSGNPMLL